MQIPKIPFIAVACALIACSPGRARGEESHATVKEAGLFSYQAPPSWIVMKTPGMRHPISTDVQLEKGMFRTLIWVDTQTSEKSLADFAAAQRARLEMNIVVTKALDESPFVTDAGLKGIRMVARANRTEDEYNAIYYFFEGGKDKDKGVKLVVSAVSSISAFEKNATLFDAAVKTFVAE